MKAITLTEPETKPTIAQMKSRMLSGHVAALKAIAEGENPYSDHPAHGPGYFRGMRTVVETLERWEVITSERVEGEKRIKFEITERGKELLAATR